MMTAVKYFDSVMGGAPALSGTAGTLIGVLDACLVSGFGSVTLSSLVVTDNIATGTVSTGHNFAMAGNTGPVIRIEGATPAGLNGDWRIASIPTGTTFTFATTGISNQTATGTISAKRAPAGWAKAFAGTNKAAYARTALEATSMVLRVDDSPAQYPTLTMYETMSDVDTGTGASTTRYFAKSTAANSTARAWRLIADDRLMYLFANADGNTWPSVMTYGDIVPYRTSDAYHCLLLGHAAADTASPLFFVDGTTSGAELARSYTQVGSKVASGRYSHRACIYLGAGSLTLPNYADNAFHAWPVQVLENSNVARGEMPGLLCPIHGSLMADGTVLSGAPLTLLIQQTYSASYQAALNISGPWR